MKYISSSNLDGSTLMVIANKLKSFLRLPLNLKLNIDIENTVDKPIVDNGVYTDVLGKSYLVVDGVYQPLSKYNVGAKGEVGGIRNVFMGELNSEPAELDQYIHIVTSQHKDTDGRFYYTVQLHIDSSKSIVKISYGGKLEGGNLVWQQSKEEFSQPDTSYMKAYISTAGLLTLRVKLADVAKGITVRVDQMLCEKDKDYQTILDVSGAETSTI